MKKIFLIVAFLVAGIIGTNAQGGTLSAGFRLGLPIGDFSKTHSFGAGLELQGEYYFNEYVSAVLNTGYTHFLGTKEDLLGASVKFSGQGYIPILLGMRYYPGTNFFIGAQAGYGILTGGGSDDDEDVTEDKGSSGAFNYQPQIGYNGARFQLAVNYNALSKKGSTISHIGLTATFKLATNKE